MGYAMRKGALAGGEGELGSPAPILAPYPRHRDAVGHGQQP